MTLMLNVVVALGLLAVQGQDRPRYGTASDLRGLTRVFIDTGSDVTARNRIVRELRAAGAALVIVQELESAEILLEFGSSVERQVGGWVTNTRRDKDDRKEQSVTTTTEQKIRSGAGTVFVRRDDALLAVESFADEKRVFFERDPATNFSRAFLRLYRRANGLVEER